MQVIFRTTEKLLKIGDLRESLLEVDKKFRNQFFRLVLDAVREGEISLHNKNGISVSVDEIKKIAYAAASRVSTPLSSVYKLARTKPENNPEYLAVLNEYIGAYFVRISRLTEWSQEKHGLEVLIPAPVDEVDNAQSGAPGKDAPLAPLVTPSDKKLKRGPLIKELEREWPSIERDLRDASRSPELQSAKVPGRHGYWYLERVKTWGRENGKIAPVQDENAIQSNDIAAQLRAVKAAARTHRIE